MLLQIFSKDRWNSWLFDWFKCNHQWKRSYHWSKDNKLVGTASRQCSKCGITQYKTIRKNGMDGHWSDGL